MKYLIITLAFVGFAYANPVHADCSLTPCGNGSPDSVVNAWGTTNSQLPKIKQGETRNGYTCPYWFPMYCVDISGTQYFKLRWTR